MSRLSVLAAQPRIALGALLTMLLAAAAVVGSGADFTASSANPSNTFASGTLSILNSEEGSAVLTATNLRPGGPAQTGEVDIKNSGSLSGAFTLKRSTPVDTGSTSPLSQMLNITVVDCGDSAAPNCAGGQVKYSGTLAAMTDTALGTYAANQEHRYRFTVQLDEDADDDYQGGSSEVTFNFDAVQS
jgi:spore coat-associated protein N